MFKSEFQGGPLVDIFSAQGKDPVAKWKLYGGQSAISKEYDKEVKSYVYILGGNSQTNKMQLPKDSKTLGLSQRFLVLQVYVPLGKDFSTELTVTDLGNLKRRLYLSTVHKEFCATPLHARIPLSALRRNVWCNMCIDLVSFTGEIFKGSAFLTLDGIVVSASCRLRRIFTMKLQPVDNFSEDACVSNSSFADTIPRSFLLPADVTQVLLLLNMDKVQLAEIKAGSTALETERTSSSRSTVNQDASHIAFGSKVQGPPPPTIKRTTAQSGLQVTSTATRTSRTSGSTKKTSRDGIQKKIGPHEPTFSQWDDSLQHVKDSTQPHHVLEGKTSSFRPHPPQVGLTSEKTGVRSLRERRYLSGASQTRFGNRVSCAEDHPIPRRISISPSPIEHGDDTSTDPATALLRAMSRLAHSARGREFIMANRLLNKCQKELSPAPHLPLERDKCFYPCSELGRDSVDSQLYKSSSSGSVSSQDSIEVTEPHFQMKDKFMFFSRPHSARQLRRQTWDLTPSCDLSHGRDGTHRGAKLEDDFIGSESEEEEACLTFPGQSPNLESSQGIEGLVALNDNDDWKPADTSFSQDPESQSEPQTANATQTYQSAASGPERYNADHSSPLNMEPMQSLSPKGARIGQPVTLYSMPMATLEGPSKMAVSRRSLREIPRGSTKLSVESTADLETENPPKVFYLQSHIMGSTGMPAEKEEKDLGMLTSLHKQQEEEELKMLASLCRQKEEEELRGDSRSPGLSASQIKNCNISISTSSDDTSTWIPSLHEPVNQGQHYQAEMNPLLHSNPRDWLEVLSPPIFPFHEQKVRDGMVDPGRGFVKGDKVTDNTTEEDEEFLTLLYDPCLNCYFDPETGKYYELV